MILVTLSFLGAFFIEVAFNFSPMFCFQSHMMLCRSERMHLRQARERASRRNIADLESDKRYHRAIRPGIGCRAVWNDSSPQGLDTRRVAGLKADEKRSIVESIEFVDVQSPSHG